MQSEEPADTRAGHLRFQRCDIGAHAHRVRGARDSHSHFRAEAGNRGSSSMPRGHVSSPRGIILGWL